MDHDPQFAQLTVAAHARIRRLVFEGRPALAHRSTMIVPGTIYLDEPSDTNRRLSFELGFNMPLLTR